MRFLLKAGKHQDGHPAYRLKDNKRSKDTRRFFDSRDDTKNTVTTEIDLVKMFGAEKFERLPDEPKAKKK